MRSDFKRLGLMPFLVVGLILRLALSLSTSHPDLWGHTFTAYHLPFKGIFNVYDHLANLPPSDPLVKNFGTNYIFIYPSLTYFTLGGFMWLLKPFHNQIYIESAISNLDNIFTYPQIFIHLFLMKLPYLVFDFASAITLMSLFNNDSQKRKALILWWFNPVTLYATFMIGQFDIIPTFFTLLSVYMFSRHKPTSAMFMLGISAAFKSYALFILLPCLVLGSKSIADVIKRGLVGFLPLIITTLPFVLSPAYRSQVLFSPQSQKMLYLALPVSGADFIYLFILGWGIILISTLVMRPQDMFSSAVNINLSVLLILFSTTNYHPQWMLWITPFVIIYLVSGKPYRVWPTLFLLAMYTLIVLSFDASLNYGLFSPLYPPLKDAKSLFSLLPKFIDQSQIRSLTRTIFASAAAIVLIDLGSSFKINQHKD